MIKSLKSRAGLTIGRRKTVSVTNQWVQSKHRCSAIHAAFTTLTCLETITNEQIKAGEIVIILIKKKLFPI